MGNSDFEIEYLTKQIARGGGVALFGQGLSKGIKFILQVVLTRVLGSASYGLYTLGLSAIGIIQGISMLGLPQGTLRFGSLYLSEGKKSRVKGTIISSFLISLISSAIIGIVIFFWSSTIAGKIFNEPELGKVLKILSLTLPFFSLFSVCMQAFLIFKKIEYSVGIELVFIPLVSLLIVIPLFALGLRLNGAIYAYILSIVSSLFLGFFLLRKIFPELFSELKPEYEIKPLFLYSLSVLLVGLSGFLINKVDKIMIGIFMTSQNVGIYNAASVVAFQGSLIIYSFHGIFAPIITDLHNKKKFSELGLLLKSSTKWAFGLVMPLVFIFILFSKEIMLLFGNEFLPGWSILITFSFIQLVNVGVGSVGYILIMTGKEKIELTNVTVLGLLNVVLNYFLIPKFGILGAAIATGISYALIDFARVIEIYYFYKIHPYKFSYLKIIFAGLVAIGLVIFLRNLIEFQGWLKLLEVAIMCVVYGIMVFIMRLDKEDIIVLKAVRNKIFKEE